MVSAKCPRPPGRWENTPYGRRFAEPLKGPRTLYGAMVENHPISAKHQSTIHKFGKKVSPGIFLGYELIGEFGKEILIAVLKDLEKLDASEIYPRRINAKEKLIR